MGRANKEDSREMQAGISQGEPSAERGVGEAAVEKEAMSREIAAHVDLRVARCRLER
jgi:hypothetical protein